MFKEFINKKKIIAVVGLGYVGLPLAVALSKKFNIIGFDVDNHKINEYLKGNDLTGDIGDNTLSSSNIYFTSDESDLSEASLYIVAVPTPITQEKSPDFTYINSASETVGKYISKGNLVVYESTVYPGVTEDICVPILEKTSSLKCGVDFKVGYSPERINPGDKVHTIDNIVKIVSAMDDESLELIASIYEEIITAGVYRASSIKVAEAAKVIENTQRDINIAFINEISMVFNEMEVNTFDVLKAAGTKWNFLNFKPGLVGGHCISVDPYYFMHKAKELGFHSQIIAASRTINDNFGKYIGESIVKKMILNDKKIKNSNVLILGIAFKENSNDIRNTRVIDIIDTLREYGINVFVNDPFVDKIQVKKVYGIDLIDDYTNNKYDAIVVAVAHDCYSKIDFESILGIFSDNSMLFDIKSCFKENDIKKLGIDYWSL